MSKTYDSHLITSTVADPHEPTGTRMVYAAAVTGILRESELHRTSWFSTEHLALCAAQTWIDRQEANRKKRNRNARERHAALSSLGLKRTPYGYE